MSLLLFILLMALLFFLLIYAYFWHSHNYWGRRGVPTRAPSFPFGNMYSVIFRYQSVNEKVWELYNEMKFKGHKYAGLYIFSRKVFIPIDPDLVKRILSRDFVHFHDRGIHYDEEHDPMSAHLVSLAGDAKWRKLRAKLTPAFTSGKIKYMFGTMQRCAEQIIDVVNNELISSVEIKDVLARFATDVIGSCAFGIECNSLNNPQAEFRLMGKRAFTQTPTDAFKMIVIRSFPQVARFLELGVFARSVSNFFKRVVHETIHYRLANNVVREDFLQLLIQLMKFGKLEQDDHIDEFELQELSLNEATAQACIFFLAGFETTSTTISFALFELAQNNAVQNKSREEVTRILKKYHGKLTYEAIGELTYLEMIVLESLRKFPPAPVILRKCTKEYLIPGTDIVIEKGMSVLIPAMALHRDPEYFPKPNIFDPERFNEENKPYIQDFTYIPFGDGPRICIGMRFAMVQSKLALATILLNYRFTLNKKTQLPLVMEKKGIVLSPIGGIWIDFEQI